MIRRPPGSAAAPGPALCRCVGAVGVRVRGVVASGAGGRERALARGGDDRVGEVGGGRLDVADEGGQVDRERAAVLVHGGGAVVGERGVVDRRDRDRDRPRHAGLGGVAGGAGRAAVVRVAAGRGAGGGRGGVFGVRGSVKKKKGS